MIDAALLGTGGMMPLKNRFLSSMCLRINGRLLIIDCGEGTQITHKQLGWGFSNIDVFCFTHFHADHISGLAGMMLAIGNAERREPITMVGPAGLKDIVRCLLVIAPDLPFDINFIELSGQTENIKVSAFNLSALPLNHGAPCFGYGVSLSRPGKFDTDKAQTNNVPLKLWSALQKGETVNFEGKTFTPSMVLGETRRGLKITYCTDTRPTREMAAFAQNSDLFVCEGLYGAEEMRKKAENHNHMVFSEAALTAEKARARELWLTHFSPALLNPKAYIDVARDIFPNAYIGFDRKNKTFRFED